MPILNTTKNTTIAKKARKCKSILSKTIGLMFSKKSDKALIFTYEKEQLIPIHMFFVFYPIDLIYLNKNKKVVEIRESIKPFQLYHGHKLCLRFSEKHNQLSQ